MIADRNIDEELFRSFIRDAASFFEPQMLTQGIDLNQYAEKLIRKATIAYAQENERIIGAVIGYTHDTRDNTSFITQIYVVPEKRGQGLNQRLLKEYADYCKSIGLDAIWLTTKKTNKVAQSSYERFGFVCSGEHTESTLKYVKSLKNAGNRGEE